MASILSRPQCVKSREVDELQRVGKALELLEMRWCQFFKMCILSDSTLARLTGQIMSYTTYIHQPQSQGATAQSSRRQDGADAVTRFEKFLPARASLRLPISLKFATEYDDGMVHLEPKTTDSCHLSFLYNNPRKIRHETTGGEKPG